MQNLLKIALLPLVMNLAMTLNGQTFGFDGQLIGWTVVNPSDPLQVQGGLRYIPEINFQLPLGKLTLEGEGSLNIWGSATYTGSDTLSIDEKLEPYRVWVKLSGDQFELRAGLQKINFGSANMIRPLMWFDQLDPKDPLQLTKGVYGLLGRYYFLNNANLWFWTLYGNNERKGLEIYPSEKNSLEVGGRVQLPLPIGESAFTYHHRTADPSLVLPPSVYAGESCPENRYAFDIKVDVGIGLWFEGALTRQNSDLLLYNNTSLLNAGLDYTFSVGNGITILSEALLYMQGEEWLANDQQVVFGGISLSYPINIIHSLSAIIFIDPINKELYRFLNWSATFDRWSFYTMAFWNPDKYMLPGFEQEANIFSGAGFQFMAVFNH